MTANFLLFAGDNFYPAGGWDDFRGFFRTPEDALAHLSAGYFSEWDIDHLEEDRQWHNWAHIVDLLTGRIVAKYDNRSNYTCDFKQIP
jgi:hypothetical protein